MLEILLVISAIFFFNCSRSSVKYHGHTDLLPPKNNSIKLSLHIFKTGSMQGQGWAVYSGGEGIIDLDQPSFLIKHPSKGLILFEAGFNSKIAKEKKDYTGCFLHTTGLLAMHQDSGQSVKEQMIHYGFNPDSIKAIIPSHFHPEHSGAIEEFPNADIWIDSKEYTYIMNNPKYNFFKKEFDDVKKWNIIENFPILWKPFSGAIDVFGDQSIFVLSTPGHTPGHLSIYLNLQSGPVLLTGDIAWVSENISSQSIGAPFVSVDAKGARESLGKLIHFKEKNPKVTIVPGHDLSPLKNSNRKDVTIIPWIKTEP